MAKLIMVGTCPHCGRTITSKYPFQLGLCHCKNLVVQIPLELAIIPVPKIQKMLEVVEEYSGIPAEQLVSKLLEETSEALVRGLKINKKEKKSHPSIKIL